MIAEPLTETAVLTHLTTCWLGRSYYHLHTVDSTNNLLKQMLAAGNAYFPPAGTLVLAEFQHQGRGRLDRQWQAPPGTSLLFSLLLRPNWPPDRAGWLTMAASLAAVRAITAVCHVPAAIKWPNDIMVQHDNAWRKVGGILLEGEFDAHGCYAVAIMGIGINVNMLAPQLPETATLATSLLLACGQPVSRLALLLALLAELEALLDEAEAGRSPQAEWQARLMMLGQPVQVSWPENGRTLTGIAAATDEWGQLLVTDSSGQVHAIAAADVTLRPNS